MPHEVTQGRRHSSAIAVERAIDLLSVLAERGDAGVGELAQTLGLSGGATHRLLVALRLKGVVEQDPTTGRYSLAWFLVSLARSVVAKNNLGTVSIPFMTELRDVFGETVSLFARSGFERVCVEQLEGTREFHWRAELGKTFPLYAGASGKLILAHFPTGELEKYFGAITLERLTPQTKTTRLQLERELNRIRQQGWAISCQDRIGDAGGAAAPIYNHAGVFQAALTIAAPAWRMSANDFATSIPPLVDAALQVSRLLGFTGERTTH